MQESFRPTAPVRNSSPVKMTSGLVRGVGWINCGNEMKAKLKMKDGIERKNKPRRNRKYDETPENKRTIKMNTVDLMQTDASISINASSDECCTTALFAVYTRR